MDLKENNLKFKKTMDNDFNIEIKSTKTQPNREMLELMERYNFSLNEANTLIENIKKIEQGKLKIPKYDTPQNNNEQSSKQNKIINYDDDSRINNDYSNKTELTDIVNNNKTNDLMNVNLEQNPDILYESQNNSKLNVDSILGEIIPDYNQHVSIELKNIDLTFKVSNEKVDTIKELFIRTIKRNNSKKFEVHALKNISFKIYKGEKIGIIGYNGAGKSTLLNVISGIYPPDKGVIKTNGNISPLLALGAGFDNNYSGRKNIFLNGAVLGYDKKFLESKVNEIIEFSELGEFIDIPIKNYSSGMLAKLGFAIATAVDPDILIIDEILGVGDVNFKKKSGDKIKSLMDGGTTVLIVSHSIPQIRELCDKAIWIDKGELREMGEVNKVCDHYLKDAENASNEQLANIQFR